MIRRLTAIGFAGLLVATPAIAQTNQQPSGQGQIQTAQGQSGQESQTSGPRVFIETPGGGGSEGSGSLGPSNQGPGRGPGPRPAPRGAALELSMGDDVEMTIQCGDTPIRECLEATTPYLDMVREAGGN